MGRFEVVDFATLIFWKLFKQRTLMRNCFIPEDRVTFFFKVRRLYCKKAASVGQSYIFLASARTLVQECGAQMTELHFLESARTFLQEICQNSSNVCAILDPKLRS